MSTNRESICALSTSYRDHAQQFGCRCTGRHRGILRLKVGVAEAPGRADAPAPPRRTSPGRRAAGYEISELLEQLLHLGDLGLLGRGDGISNLANSDTVS